MSPSAWADIRRQHGRCDRQVLDGLFCCLDMHQATGNSGRDREFRFKWHNNGGFSEVAYAVKVSEMLVTAC